MNSTEMIALFISAGTLSTVFALVYALQEKFKTHHQWRLIFLKAHIVFIWLVPLISSFLLSSQVAQSVGSLLPASEALSWMVVDSKTKTPVMEVERWSIATYLVGFYLFGLSMMIARLSLSFSQMRRVLSNSRVIQVAGRKVRLIEGTTSPFSFGLFNPQIYVPSDFLVHRTEKEIEVMLVHEETHIRNQDPQWKLFSIFTKAFLFFVPSVYYLHRKLDLEIEIECDRNTIQVASLSTEEYGNLLIDTVLSLQNSRHNPMFAYMSSTNLNRRIQAMTLKTFRTPMMNTFLGILIFVASATAIAALSGASKFRGQFLVKAEFILNGKVISSPRLVVLPHEPASLQMKTHDPETELKLDLIAADDSSLYANDAIHLKMAVKYKNEKQTFESKPHALLAPGKVGIIQIGSDAGDLLELKVQAERL